MFSVGDHIIGMEFDGDEYVEGYINDIIDLGGVTAYEVTDVYGDETVFERVFMYEGHENLLNDN